MTGFNLPPGCNVSDLPGNTKEEQEAEVAYDKLCEELEIHKLLDPVQDDEEWSDKLVQFIMRKMGEAYGAGYQEGSREERAQQEQQEIEKAAKEWRENSNGQ